MIEVEHLYKKYFVSRLLTFSPFQGKLKIFDYPIFLKWREDKLREELEWERCLLENTLTFWISAIQLLLV